MGKEITSTDKVTSAPRTHAATSPSPSLLSEALGWAADNIGKPLANAALITPWEAIASTTNLVSVHSKADPLLYEPTTFKVPTANFLSFSWFAQGLSGGVGMILPYVAAGRLTGGAMRSVGETLELEGNAARIFQSEKLSTILGAGIYDGMREPTNGETRFGNSMAGLVGFSFYEYGNAWKPHLNLAATIGKRAVVGVIGATAQKTVASELSDKRLPTFDEYLQTGVSGAVLNVAMPPTQDRLVAGFDALNHKLGRGVPIDHYLASHENPSALSSTLRALVSKNPWVRVQDGADVDAADARHKLVQLAGDHPDPAKLGHELKHIQVAKEAAVKAGYDEAQKLLLAGKVSEARNIFINTYFDSELDARITENMIGEELGVKPHLEDVTSLSRNLPLMEAHPGHTYAEDAVEAFEHFVNSDGRIRPSIEYGGTSEATSEPTGTRW